MDIGIAGRHERVTPLLERLKSMLNEGGRIIGTGNNWDRTTMPWHLEVHKKRANSKEHPLDLKIRMTYEGLEEQLEWCLVSQNEMKRHASAAGLKMEVVIDCESRYGYVLSY